MPPPFFPRVADLLLLLWPVFFVAVARQDPHLKVRNFKKSMKEGSENVVRFVQPVRLSSSLRRRNELGKRAGQQTAADTGEKRPAWENMDASARPQVCVTCMVTFTCRQ